MDFREAGDLVVSIGKHRGRTVDDVATTDEGLLWLDWLRGMRERSGPRDALYTAVCVYLDDPSIAKDLAKLASRR